MAILVTNSVQIARFANALYGIKLGSNTNSAVAEDVKDFGLAATVNAYYNYSFGSKTTSEVADIILANVGLTGDTAAHNLVVGKLNAAGSAKGAAILDMLNDFSNLTSDATYGAAATAWNATVAAAQAYTAANTEDVATGATTSATFTLTTGVDNGSAFTGGAGNNTFNATDLTLGSLDTITGGAAADTLNIVSATSLTTLKGTVTGVETLNVTAAGSVGNVASSATIAAKQSQTYDWAGTDIVIGGSVVMDIGGVSTTLATTADTTVMATNTAAAINTILNASYGTTGTTYASSTTTVVTYNSPTAAKALPTITFSKGTGNTTLAAPKAVVVQANQAAADAVAAATFTAPTGTTAFNVTADGNAFLAGKSTSDTVVSAGGVVKLATSKNVDITAADSVAVTGATGTVKVATSATATSIASQFAVASGGTSTSGAGVTVQGGTTVDITVSQASTAINTGKIQVGAITSAVDGANSTLYPQTIGNLSKDPSGNVTITGVTNSKSATTGLTTAYYNNGAVEVTTNGGTTVTVKGIGATSTVTDAQTQTIKSTADATAAAGTSTLTTVNLAGLAAGVTIKSDAISTVSVADTLTAQTVTLSGSAATKNTGALNVSFSNVGVTGGAAVTIDAPNVSSVNVSSGAAGVDKINAGGATVTSNAGSASTVTLNTPKATSINFSNTLPVTLSGQTVTNAAKVASITAAGSGAVTLGDVSALHAADKALTSIDASASSGALTVSIGATDNVHGLSVKGGSGDDAVTVLGAIGNTTTASGTVVTTSIDLGAGNDKLIKNGGSLTAGASIDGGAGTDTISGTFLSSGVAGLVKNFETVDIAGITGTYDMSLYTASSFNSVAISGAVTAATTVSKLSGTNVGVTVTSSAATTAIAAVTATLASSAGTADTATISFAPTKLDADATATMAGFTTTGIETINVSSTQTQLVASTTKVGTGVITLLTDTSNTSSSIVITGNGNFTLSGVAQNTAATTASADVAAALTLIDGSASTGVVTVTAGASSAAIGTTTFVTKYDGLTIKGGAGADSLTNNAKAGVVNGGAGIDAITVAGAGAVVDGGSGADTITVSAAVSTTLTGGTGADTFNVSSALLGSLTSNKFTTITDLAAADKIQFAFDTGITYTAAKIDVSAASSLATAYDLAAAGSGATTAALVKWFQFGGDTYIVEDRTAGSTLAITDAVVKLTGLIDLSSSTMSAGGLLTIV